MKTKTLKQKGWIVAGTAVLHLWGGGTGEIQMNETFVPLGQMSKDNLMRCINDGRFGCMQILSAYVEIYDAYENGYREFNRFLNIDNPDPKLTCRGI